MPLHEQSRGSGAIAVFNFKAELTPRDLIVLFGTFGQIFDVDPNVAQPQALMEKVVLKTTIALESQNITNNDTNNNNNTNTSRTTMTETVKPPKGFGDKRAAVVQFSEIEDAEMAVKNMNGYMLNGEDPLFVAMVRGR